MKPLENVLRMEGDNVVMDCCPTEIIEDWQSSPVSKRHLCKGNPSDNAYAFPEEITRSKHIFYLGIGITWVLVEEKGFIDVTCPTCKSTYRLEKDKGNYGRRNLHLHKSAPKQ